MPAMKRFEDKQAIPPRRPTELYPLGHGNAWPPRDNAFETMEIERDRYLARAVELEAAKQLREIGQRLAGATGLPATNALEAAEDRIAETRTAAISRAESPRMRAMLEDALDRRAGILREELAARVELGRKAAERDQLAQDRATAHHQAIDAETPLVLHASLRAMHHAIDRQGIFEGWDAAETAAEKFRVTSRVHGSWIGRMVASGDLEAALAHRAAINPALSARDSAEIDAMLADLKSSKFENSDLSKNDARTFGVEANTPFGVPVPPDAEAPFIDDLLSIEASQDTLFPSQYAEVPGPGVEDAGRSDAIGAELIPVAAQDLRTKIEDEGLYDGTAGLDMNGHVIAFARRHRQTILRVSKRLGIPATAVAAAIGEEYRTWGLFKDGVGEAWTKLQVIMGGAPVPPRFRGQLPDNNASKYLERAYLSMRARIEKGEVIQNGGVSKLLTPMAMDVGPGNINIGTAMHLLEKYMKKYAKDDFLGLKGYVGNYDIFFRDLSNPESDLTVKIASLKIREVLDEFENIVPDDLGSSRAARDYFRSLSPAHRDALLDFGYRRSPDSVRKGFRDKDGSFVIPRGWTNRTRTDYEEGKREGTLFYDYFFDPASPYDAVNGILDGSNFPSRPRAKRPKKVPAPRGRDRYRLI